MNPLQIKLLELFKYTISFLEQHNLRYVAGDGTVLGAARHKGFIPWDDDIDIYMWREDYNKLLSLKQELLKDNYDVVSAETDEGYYNPFAKIIDRSTTIWAKEEYPFIMGVFIDIFPLDAYESEKAALEAQQRSNHLFSTYRNALLAQQWKGLDPLKLFAHHIKNKEFLAALYVWRDLYNKNRLNACLHNWINFENSHHDEKGNFCCSPSQWRGRALRSSWFHNTTIAKFDNIDIVVPEAVDEYLTFLYHDWRTLPPEDQRNDTHEDQRLYFNLHEGLSMAEVKQRLANGEHIVM